MKQIFTAVLYLLFSTGSMPQNGSYTGEPKFDKISVEQGLSQSTVFDICQDSKGFIWIGTLDGLNKYDGYKFTLYKSNPDDKYSLSHNYVFTIFEDKEEYLWIGTLGGGLNRFDKRSERFYSYIKDDSDEGSISDNHIRVIYEDKAGNLWVGTNSGLNKFDSKTGKFKRYRHSPEKKGSISNDYIWSIYEDRSGVLWIGTYGGLNKFNKADETFTAYQHNPEDEKSLSSNYIWSILEDSEGNFWIGTSKGLNLFDRQTGKAVYFNNSAGKSGSLSHDNVWQVYEDSKGVVWAATLGGGLNRIIKKGGRTEFIRYAPDPKNPYSLSHSHVWSVFEDNAGVLWIGTDVGLNKYDRGREKFKHIYKDAFKKNTLSDNEVLAVTGDNEGNIWIGTRHGLDKYNMENGSFVHFENNTNNKPSLSNNFIRALYTDKRGTVWIGTNGGGLNRYIKDNTFKSYQFGLGEATISSNSISSIAEDNEGILWIGTLAGLNRLDLKTEKFRHYLRNPETEGSLSHDYVSAIYVANDDEIWIGTLGGGLNRFDKRSERFTVYKNEAQNRLSISSNYIFTIAPDPRGDNNILWIGTSDGLNRFDKKDGSFRRYTEKSGLLSDVIYGILSDKEGNLWLSTNKGITKFNYIKNKYNFYSTDDGVQGFQFSMGAYYKNKKGEMFLGGINGLNIFHPDSIRDNPHIPAVVITDFLIFNKPVEIGNNSPINNSITETDTIELSYSQDVFSFEFAALNYSSPQNNQYAYKLEGFDKDWFYTNDRRFITYTNLDPGEYVFKVKGSNNDGVWNEEGVQVAVIVNPPFWMTWWFILITILLLGGITASVIYFRIQQLLTVERLRLKIAQDLHDDIGTRLTEISLLSDMYYHIHKKNNTPEEKDTIKNIGSIARAVIDNMSEIVWLINPKRDSLYELFLKLRDSYEDILSYSNIILHINNFSFLEKIKLPMEYRKNLYLIFKEGMNNALKHSGCKEISINAQLRGRILDITLYDNGKGIDLNKPCCGNGVDNMKFRAEAIGGKLRIQSNPDEGTMIKFTGRI